MRAPFSPLTRVKLWIHQDSDFWACTHTQNKSLEEDRKTKDDKKMDPQFGCFFSYTRRHAGSWASDSQNWTYFEPNPQTSPMQLTSKETARRSPPHTPPSLKTLQIPAFCNHNQLFETCWPPHRWTLLPPEPLWRRHQFRQQLMRLRRKSELRRGSCFQLLRVRPWRTGIVLFKLPLLYTYLLESLPYLSCPLQVQ